MPEKPNLRHIPNFDKPELARTLKLSSAQAGYLWPRVDQIVGDIQSAVSLAKREPDRKARNTILKSTIAGFDELERRFLNSNGRVIDPLLRETILPELGSLLSHDGLIALTGVHLGSDI